MIFSPIVCPVLFSGCAGEAPLTTGMKMTGLHRRRGTMARQGRQLGCKPKGLRKTLETVAVKITLAVREDARTIEIHTDNRNGFFTLVAGHNARVRAGRSR